MSNILGLRDLILLIMSKKAKAPRKEKDGAINQARIDWRNAFSPHLGFKSVIHRSQKKKRILAKRRGQVH